MLFSVVFDADLELFSAHVDAPTGHDDLRFRPRQSRVEEHQPRPRFLWRLGAAVHQLDDFARQLSSVEAAFSTNKWPLEVTGHGYL